MSGLCGRFVIYCGARVDGRMYLAYVTEDLYGKLWCV